MKSAPFQVACLVANLHLGAEPRQGFCTHEPEHIIWFKSSAACMKKNTVTSFETPFPLVMAAPRHDEAGVYLRHKQEIDPHSV